jgi:hypothetical protein
LKLLATNPFHNRDDDEEANGGCDNPADRADHGGCVRNNAISGGVSNLSVRTKRGEQADEREDNQILEERFHFEPFIYTAAELPPMQTIGTELAFLEQLTTVKLTNVNL